MFKFKNPAKPVQLVKHFADVKSSDLLYPAYCEVKEDGVYAAFYYNADDQLEILSRTGKAFYTELVRALEENAILTCIPKGYVTICEVVNPELSLEELSGLVNPNRVNVWLTPQWNTMRYNTKFVVHDIIQTKDFFDGHCNDRFNTRHALLRTFYPRCFCTRGRVVFSEQEFHECAKIAIEEERAEGVVMKQLRAPWIAGHKGKHAVKLVRGVSYDLACTGATFGKGKRAGFIGALHFDFKGKAFKADLGAGWTDERRAELTNQYNADAASVVGKIFKVVALQESSKGVLRLPKVEEMRIDKTEADDV